jgi:hypothetical protein
MDIIVVRTFFLWCTIINVGLLILTGLIFTLGREFVYRIQSRWYPMPKESFNVVIYAFIGFFKVVVIVFNLVPLVALTILT